MAARRKDRVIGRTKVLKVSITTRNGLSHIGAPEGSRWAAKDVGLYTMADKTIINQMGRPKEKEKRMWDENLKE